MAIFENSDPRSLSYRNEDEVIENIVESFGYKLNQDGALRENEKTYCILNDYQVRSWDRSKRGFLKEEYKGFSIMEHYYDGWNAKHTIKYGEPSKSYSVYIRLGMNYIQLSDAFRIIDRDKVTAFANGDNTDAKEESIATEMKKIYMDYVESSLF